MSQKLTKLTNCRLAIDSELVWRDLWVSGTTGQIVDAQEQFFDQHASPSKTRDLGGRIVAPGLVDVQLNGGFGFDFSLPSDRYEEGLRTFNRKLLETGVTSYLPTLTSQKREVYRKVVPFLAASDRRDAYLGAESLGAHCEGPFINQDRNGIHKKEHLQRPHGFAQLLECYGPENMDKAFSKFPRIKLVTLAPELDCSGTVIRQLRSRGIIVSVGHTAATYPEMIAAAGKGASMVTHLFNAISPLLHRDPGVFGVLGLQEGTERPYYGVIADSIHVHQNMVNVAYKTCPDRFILVTDAMSVMGLADGDYSWTNGEIIQKRGSKVTLKGSNGTIAGSCVTLIECISNLMNWADISPAKAIEAATSTPAQMLGISNRKGTLRPGSDADFVVISENEDRLGAVKLKVDEVWKFGVLMEDSPAQAQGIPLSRL